MGLEEILSQYGLDAATIGILVTALVRAARQAQLERKKAIRKMRKVIKELEALKRMVGGRRNTDRPV